MSNNDEMKKYMRIVESASIPNNDDIIDDIVSLCNDGGFMITPDHVKAYMSKGENGLHELMDEAAASMEMNEWYKEHMQNLEDLVSQLHISEAGQSGFAFSNEQNRLMNNIAQAITMAGYPGGMDLDDVKSYFNDGDFYSGVTDLAAHLQINLNSEEDFNRIESMLYDLEHTAE